MYFIPINNTNTFVTNITGLLHGKLACYSTALNTICIITNTIITLQNIYKRNWIKITFFLLQYMGSFPVAIPDIASRAEYVRSQLETLIADRLCG